jgi:RNA polymerase sigma-70 factor (ECF subfamily)
MGLVETPSTSRSVNRSASTTRLATEVASLYQAHAPELLRYAGTLLSDRDAARDAVQEAFLRYFLERRYGREIDNPRAWLYQVLRNYGLDHLNTFAVKNQVTSSSLDHLPAQEHNPEQILQGSEITRELQATLTARESDCLRLRIQGLSYAEIARALGVRSGTVGALLTRAHRKVLEAVG